MNPKTELSKGNLYFFENQILLLLGLHHHLRLMNLVPRMTTGSRNSTPSARGIGMKKKSKDQGYLIVVSEGGAQHIESRGGVNGIHRRFMKWG